MAYELKCLKCGAIGESDEPLQSFNCPLCGEQMAPFNKKNTDDVATIIISRKDLTKEEIGNKIFASANEVNKEPEVKSEPEPAPQPKVEEKKPEPAPEAKADVKPEPKIEEKKVAEKAAAPKAPVKPVDAKKPASKAPAGKKPRDASRNERGYLLKRTGTGKFEVILDKQRGNAVYTPDGTLLSDEEMIKFMPVYLKRRQKVQLLILGIAIAVVVIASIIVVALRSGNAKEVADYRKAAAAEYKATEYWRANPTSLSPEERQKAIAALENYVAKYKDAKEASIQNTITNAQKTLKIMKSANGSNE